MVKNPPSNTGDPGSIPFEATKDICRDATTKPVAPRAHALQQEKLEHHTEPKK